MAFYIKRNDTSPRLLATLKDAQENVVDITGTTIKFLMKDKDGTVKVNSAASIVDGPNGQVRYNWSTGDTDTDGTYRGEFEVTFQGGEIETFPNDDYIQIIIQADIA